MLGNTGRGGIDRDSEVVDITGRERLRSLGTDALLKDSHDESRVRRRGDLDRL